MEPFPPYLYTHRRVDPFSRINRGVPGRRGDAMADLIVDWWGSDDFFYFPPSTAWDRRRPRGFYELFSPATTESDEDVRRPFASAHSSSPSEYESRCSVVDMDTESEDDDDEHCDDDSIGNVLPKEMSAEQDTGNSMQDVHITDSSSENDSIAEDSEVQIIESSANKQLAKDGNNDGESDVLFSVAGKIILREDLLSLQDDNLVSSGIVEAYMALLVAERYDAYSCGAFFYTMLRERGWEYARKWFRPDDPTKWETRSKIPLHSNFLAIPIFTGIDEPVGHWSLLVRVKMNNMAYRFIYIDSLNSESRFRQVVSDIRQTELLSASGMDEFTFMKSPQQSNLECGARICLAALILAEYFMDDGIVQRPLTTDLPLEDRPDLGHLSRQLVQEAILSKKICVPGWLSRSVRESMRGRNRYI